jgi:hypothetical protein
MLACIQWIILRNISDSFNLIEFWQSRSNAKNSDAGIFELQRAMYAIAWCTVLVNYFTSFMGCIYAVLLERCLNHGAVYRTISRHEFNIGLPLDGDETDAGLLHPWLLRKLPTVKQRLVRERKNHSYKIDASLGSNYHPLSLSSQ